MTLATDLLKLVEAEGDDVASQIDGDKFYVVDMSDPDDLEVLCECDSADEANDVRDELVQSDVDEDDGSQADDDIEVMSGQDLLDLCNKSECNVAFSSDYSN